MTAVHLFSDIIVAFAELLIITKVQIDTTENINIYRVSVHEHRFIHNGTVHANMFTEPKCSHGRH